MTSSASSDRESSLARLSRELEKVRENPLRSFAPSIEIDRLRDIIERLRDIQYCNESQAPIRTVHHFACTGGTVISRYLASTPNACLLSEIDPLSPLAKHRFSPFDLALHYRNTQLKDSYNDQIDIFLAALSVIYEKVYARRQRLILRDHTHSHFCTGDAVPNRPTLRQIVASKYPVLSVVTVRHPLDSYLAVVHNKFTHFSPDTLEEYAHRYMAFLDAYEGQEIIKYEDFVTDHDATMKVMCDILRLPHCEFLKEISSSIVLTGDSGRKGDDLELRGRRCIPDSVAEMRETSETYRALCERLQYPT